MSFPLVSKSVTLHEVERRKCPYFALFRRIRVASGSGAHCVKVVEDVVVKKVPVRYLIS